MCGKRVGVRGQRGQQFSVFPTWRSSVLSRKAPHAKLYSGPLTHTHAHAGVPSVFATVSGGALGWLGCQNDGNVERIPWPPLQPETATKRALNSPWTPQLCPSPHTPCMPGLTAEHVPPCRRLPSPSHCLPDLLCARAPR